MTPTRTAIALTTAALLAVTACSSDDSSDDRAQEFTVIDEELPDGAIGRADLLMPDTTVEEAQVAIRAYAEGISGPSAVTISVVRSEDAAVIVCRADWPDLDSTMNCPDPAGD